MENNKELDKVISDYNDFGNVLEQQYLEKRDEPTLDLVIRLEDLKTILKGTACVDAHEITSIAGDGEKLVIKLEKI